MKRSLAIVCILIFGLLVCGCIYNLNSNSSGNASVSGTTYNVSIPPYLGGNVFYNG